MFLSPSFKLNKLLTKRSEVWGSLPVRTIEKENSMDLKLGKSVDLCYNLLWKETVGINYYRFPFVREKNKTNSVGAH